MSVFLKWEGVPVTALSPKHRTYACSTTDILHKIVPFCRQNTDSIFQKKTPFIGKTLTTIFKKTPFICKTLTTIFKTDPFYWQNTDNIFLKDPFLSANYWHHIGYSLSRNLISVFKIWWTDENKYDMVLSYSKKNIKE